MSAVPVGERASALGPLVSAALLAGIAGAIYLALLPETRVLVPTEGLDAYHQVQEGDLTTIPLRRRLRANEYRSAEELVNRYTLSPLAAHQPVTRDRTGPKLPPKALDHVFVVSVPLGSAAGRAVAVGQQVEVAFTASGAPAPIPGVWVLAKPDDSTIVLSIPHDRRDEFMGNFGKGFVLGVATGLR